MKAAIERHNLSDRGFAETDVEVLLQISFDSERAGITIFLLQFEHRVNCAEEDFA